MCYRTVCNQNKLTNKNGVIGDLGWGKRDVRRQALETGADLVAYSEGNGLDDLTLPDQSGYIVCGYENPVTPPV